MKLPILASNDSALATEVAAPADPSGIETASHAASDDWHWQVRRADLKLVDLEKALGLLSLPGVRETHTYAVMEEIKNTSALPL